MKGYAMLKIGESGWIEKDRPKCGPMDAICRPLAVAICTSDVHTLWEGAIGDRHNMILGHEGCAEVVEVGELVRDFKPGDRVLVPAITPDWNSLEAQAGYSMHSGGMLAGWKFSNFKDGVFSEYFHVNDADGNLALLPDNINVVDACMLSDMVPTGFHGVELADVQFGDSVLVVGIGPVGLMSVAGANMRGASRIIAVGTRPVCVEAAKGYGATDFVSYKNGPIYQQVLDMTNGKGVDKIVIAGGGVETFAEAVKCLKPGGKIGNVKLPRLRRQHRYPPCRVGRWHGSQADQRRSDARRPSENGEAWCAGIRRQAGSEPSEHPCIRRLGSPGRGFVPDER